MSTITFISDDRVRQLLKWDKIFETVEIAMKSVSVERAFQVKRSALKVGKTENVLLSMPGYLEDDNYGALGYKVLTVFPNNTKRAEPLPTALANIILLDEETGLLKAIISANEITDRRTAAASVIATKYLHGHKENKILAILGAGMQGRMHATAFQEYFKFQEVRIWNRTAERAEKLVHELNQAGQNIFVSYKDKEQCVKNADVVVTATGGKDVLVKFDWLKKGAHINAIGVNPEGLELDDLTYKSSNVYVDYTIGANSELTHIKSLGVEFKGQIGDIITGKVNRPSAETTTVFQSLGMAVEDCAVARLVYDLHLKTSTYVQV